MKKILISITCLLTVIITFDSSVKGDNAYQSSSNFNVDQTYKDIAEATGGISYNFKPEDLKYLSIVDVSLFLGNDSKDPKTGIEEGAAHITKFTREFSNSTNIEKIVIDSTVKRLIVTLTSDNPFEAKLFYPNGKQVLQNGEKVAIITYSRGRVFKLREVPSGEWKLQAEGRTPISVDIQGRTAIRFYDFNFVELTMGHEGLDYFPIQRKPNIGEKLTGYAVIFGNESYATIDEFQVRLLNGKIINFIKKYENSATWDYYFGPIEVPKELSRIYVIGKDKSGNKFERMYSWTIQGVK